MLYRRFREILPVNDIKDIPQAYFIYTNSDISNLIFLTGSNPIGDFYAATTAIQLFDSKKFIGLSSVSQSWFLFFECFAQIG